LALPCSSRSARVYQRRWRYATSATSRTCCAVLVDRHVVLVAAPIALFRPYGGRGFPIGVIALYFLLSLLFLAACAWGRAAFTIAGCGGFVHARARAMS
jgi:hypothetical protein